MRRTRLWLPPIALLAVYSSGCDCGGSRVRQDWADLAASPNPVDFGDVPASTAKTLDVTLTNRGTAAVFLQAMTISENPEEFTLLLPTELNMPYSIPPGGQVVFQIRYSPRPLSDPAQYPQDDEGTLHIQSTDRDAPEYDLPLIGREVRPILELDPVPVAFASTRVKQTSPATLTITHTGSVPDTVNITTIAVTDTGDGDFSIQDHEALPIVMTPGKSTSVHLLYTPQDRHPSDSGTLTVESTAASQEHMEIALDGSSHAPRIELSTEAINFGTVTQGSNPTLSFFIRSTGDDPLIIRSMTQSSAESPKFALMPATIADPIPAGAQVEVRVTYNADDKGDDHNRITILHDDPLERVKTVELSGRTPCPDIDVEPDFVSFQLARESHTQTVDIRFYNLGDEELRLTSMQFDNPRGSFSLENQPGLPATVPASPNFPCQKPDCPFAAVTLRFSKDTPTVDDTCSLIVGSDDPDEASVTITAVGSYTP